MTARPSRPRCHSAVVKIFADRTAILLIDLQEQVLHDAHHAERVVERAATLAQHAHAAQVCVVWVQHHGPHIPIDSRGWQIDHRFTVGPHDLHLHKSYPDAFVDTGLSHLLEERAIDTLVIAGALSDSSIRATWHHALIEGYDTVLAEDAHTTYDRDYQGRHLAASDIIALTNRYAALDSVYPEVSGRALPVANIEFR